MICLHSAQFLHEHLRDEVVADAIHPVDDRRKGRRVDLSDRESGVGCSAVRDSAVDVDARVHERAAEELRGGKRRIA